MAEYYPLLAKAVAGLPNSTPEARRAIYERARKALIGQLQNLQPPLPEADVARETKALDVAMARLEAELSMPAGSAAPINGAAPELRPVARASHGDRAQGPARVNGATAPVGPTRDRTGEAKERNDPKDRNGGGDQRAGDRDTADALRLRPEAIRPEVVRPHAPLPESDDLPQGRRLGIVIAVVVVVVGLVATAAWLLRDRPEDLRAFKPAAQSTVDHGGGKIAKRVGGGQPQQTASMQQPASIKPVAPVASAAQTATAAATAKPAETAPSVPVAYRAALLVEAPDEPNRVKTYVGTVIWRLTNVAGDPGQPPGTAVHADINIPDDKLKATMDIQKNTDPSLSASHTITIVFTIAPDSPTGGIKQISLPQLRGEDSPNGEALRGSLVPIMENSFLIGLNRGDAETANIDLVKEREWFDIPILLANGRMAKLTFEKNTAGDRAINEALASWQASNSSP